MSKSTAYTRIQRLIKQGNLIETRSLVNGSGRPTKVYNVTGRNRPSLLETSADGQYEVMRFPTGGGFLVPPNEFHYSLRLFSKDLPVFNGISVRNRAKLFRALTFPTFALNQMMMNSRRKSADLARFRDNLVTEGEELVQYLRGLIDYIEAVIYSPEFRDPLSSGFVDAMNDYHDYMYDHYEDYKPILTSEVERQAWEAAHYFQDEDIVEETE